MRYLMCKSKHSGNIYAGKVPDDCLSLEPDHNKIWEKEITEGEFNKLNRIGDPLTIILNTIHCEIYVIGGYNVPIH